MPCESNPPLLDKVANSSVTIQSEFNSRALVNIGYALDTNGLGPCPLLNNDFLAALLKN